MLSLAELDQAAEELCTELVINIPNIDLTVLVRDWLQPKLNTTESVAHSVVRTLPWLISMRLTQLELPLRIDLEKPIQARKSSLERKFLWKLRVVRRSFVLIRSDGFFSVEFPRLVLFVLLRTVRTVVSLLMTPMASKFSHGYQCNRLFDVLRNSNKSRDNDYTFLSLFYHRSHIYDEHFSERTTDKRVQWSPFVFSSVLR